MKYVRRKYHFDIKINEQNQSNAGTKATEDCRAILIDMGFKNLELFFVKHPLLLPFNIFKLVAALSFYSFMVSSKSFIIIQYPLKGVNNFFKYFIKILQRKNCKVVCIIHDIDSLRSEENKLKVKNEMDRLSVYDAIISHNPSMSNWLRSNGYNGFIKEMGLFDYLIDESDTINPLSSNRNTIAYAGNLGRGNFLSSLIASQTTLHFNLYGSGFESSLSHTLPNVTWHGTFPAKEIINQVKGDFGLVWDGESIEEIKGLMGNYLRYNTPHKTSLYIVAGLPVIVSKYAAIATLVNEKNIGFTVNSLAEVSHRLSEITNECYNAMRINVLQLREQLIHGCFLREAVTGVEKYFLI